MFLNQHKFFDRAGAPTAGNFLTPLPNLQVFPGIIHNARYIKETYPTPPKTSLVFLTSVPWKWEQPQKLAGLPACFGSAPTVGNRLHQQWVTN